MHLYTIFASFIFLHMLIYFFIYLFLSFFIPISYSFASISFIFLILHICFLYYIFFIMTLMYLTYILIFNYLLLFISTMFVSNVNRSILTCYYSINICSHLRASHAKCILIYLYCRLINEV